MQIMRTEIARATSASGEPLLRVVFRGEDGECVTVDMVAQEHETGETAAVTRAREILVRTARFDAAANQYEAESDGNFDAVEVTALRSEAGEVYVFEYRDGGGGRRVPPARMPSIDAARAEAVRGAIDLLDELRPYEDERAGWLVRVYDEAGELLCSVDVEEAEAARRAGARG